MLKIQIKLEQRLRNIMITLLIIWLRMSERWKTRSALSRFKFTKEIGAVSMILKQTKVQLRLSYKNVSLGNGVELRRTCYWRVRNG